SSNSTDDTDHGAAIPRAASNSLAVICSLTYIDCYDDSLPTQFLTEALPAGRRDRSDRPRELIFRS
ncbi:hypothetical protein, partial [Verminephrobacter eiseniae]|uniref:hypothetical protein n=1 Tax=Verminephrobacter eiseniae TaxID=364317 RepID=UPI0022442966